MPCLKLLEAVSCWHERWPVGTTNITPRSKPVTNCLKVFPRLPIILTYTSEMCCVCCCHCRCCSCSNKICCVPGHRCALQRCCLSKGGRGWCSQSTCMTSVSRVRPFSASTDARCHWPKTLQHREVAFRSFNRVVHPDWWTYKGRDYHRLASHLHSACFSVFRLFDHWFEPARVASNTP